MKKINIEGKKYYLSDINKDNIYDLIKFNKNIFFSLEHKSYFIPPTHKEYFNYLKFNSKVYILYNLKKQIIAYSSLIIYRASFKNWHEDFDIPFKDIKKTAKFDSVVITKNYRHKHIFNFFENKFINYLKQIKYKYIVAHVHPKNEASLYNFLNKDYKIIKKGKFKNSVRLFLKKKLKN